MEGTLSCEGCVWRGHLSCEGCVWRGHRVVRVVCVEGT